jgi:hypothetical protein
VDVALAKGSKTVLSIKDEVEKVMGGVWIFGQLILFSMQLGSKRFMMQKE